MILKFRVMRIKDGSVWLESMIKCAEMLREKNNLRCAIKNEFIVVGEEKVNDIEYFKVNQLNENGLSIFAELDLATMALAVPKKEFIWDNITYTELDIPKKNLTVDLIADIKRLNK